MNKTLFSVLLLISISISSYSQNKVKQDNFKVLAFYMGDGSDIEKYAIDKLTHLIFTFTKLDGNNISFKNATDEKKLKHFVALKAKYPKLKVIVSFGGWGGCKTCSDVFASNTDRKAFVISVQKFINKYKLDGIDIDWESPVIGGYKNHKAQAQDKDNFTKLMKELRMALPPSCELSFDANSFETFIQKSIDWKAVMPWVDYVNLMTYGLPSNVPNTTAHHAALYSSPSQKESADRGIKELLNLGVPSEKIIIGAAFYGVVAVNIENNNNGVGQKGNFKEYISYKALHKKYAKKEGYRPFWNDTLKTTHLYNKETKTFVSFDDKKAVSLKTQYAIDNKLGGIMFWQLRGDRYKNGLLEVINQQLLNNSIKKQRSLDNSNSKKIKISEHLTLTKLSEHTYIHTQKNNNGLVYFNNNEAIIVSTPNSDIETQHLINWVKNKAEIVGYIIDRWHPDAMEGLDVVKENKIKTYANKRTKTIAQQKGLPLTDFVFNTKKEISVGNEKIICHYLGEAHTSDGIVAWVPSEKILFGGNEIRNLNGWIGNIGDANLQEWSQTAERIKKHYGSAKIVIPGHGEHGDSTLIDYTIKLYSPFSKTSIKSKSILNPLGDKILAIESKFDTIIKNKRILTDAKVTVQDTSKLIIIESPKIELNENKLKVNSKTGRVRVYDKKGKFISLRTDTNFNKLFLVKPDDTVGLSLVLKEVTTITNASKK